MARVMITDDASFMRMMIRKILEQGGHEVIAEASNGMEAVENYARFQPDLVTMDITMPEMDGVEATREITEQHTGAIILMCSAMGQKEMVMSAIKAGAKGFIVKPFDGNKVLEEIQRVLV